MLGLWWLVLQTPSKSCKSLLLVLSKSIHIDNFLSIECFLQPWRFCLSTQTLVVLYCFSGGTWNLSFMWTYIFNGDVCLGSCTLADFVTMGTMLCFIFHFYLHKWVTVTVQCQWDSPHWNFRGGCWTSDWGGAVLSLLSWHCRVPLLSCQNYSIIVFCSDMCW